METKIFKILLFGATFNFLGIAFYAYFWHQNFNFQEEPIAVFCMLSMQIMD